MSGGRGSRTAVALLAAAGLAFTTTRGLVADGSRALKEGNPKEAVAAYKQALGRAPGTPEILFDLGLAEAQAGDPAGGREHLQAALAAGGESLRPAVEYNVGNTYLAEKRWGEAAHAFEAALHADPTNRDAKANLELARRKLKEEQEKQKKEQEKQKKEKKRQQQDKQKKQDKQKEGKQGDQGKKGKQQPKERQHQGSQDKKGKEKPEERPKSDAGAKEKEAQTGQDQGGKQQAERKPRDQGGGEKGGRPEPTPSGPQPHGGEGERAGAMDPAQAAQLLNDLQRQEGDVQRQVRARLVPVAPRQRAQDW